MAKKEKKVKPKKIKPNKAILTLFILLFPVLILAMSGMVGDWILKLALFFYEAILLRNFIEDYYAEKESWKM